MNNELDKLQLMRGSDYPLTDEIFVRHPTLNEMINYNKKKGYQYFTMLISNFVAKPEDIADILWVENKVLYTDFKSSWDFFIERAYVSGEDIEVYEKQGEQIIASTTRCADIYTEECLNYFFRQKGHYVFVVKNNANTNIKDEEDNKPTVLLYNIGEEGFINDDCFKLTEIIYHLFVKYLNTIMWESSVPFFMRELQSKNPDKPIKITSKILLKALLEDAYLKRKSNQKTFITMDSIVSAIIAESSCYKDIWDFPIYLVNDQYHRINKIKAYNSTMDALNSGYYDIKKHPINWEKVDWASVISI